MSEVLRERRGHIEILTINRPEARNAVNGAVSRGIGGALDELENDDDCWVVIITGAGDKAFCAGMDLKAFAAGEIADIAGASGGFGGIARRNFPKPLIAALNGPALGGGFEIALACDLVIASEDAWLAMPEVKRGLFAAGGGTTVATRIPLAVALEMGLTGDPVTAARAEQLGLVNKVVPAGEVRAEAIKLAEKLAANGPLAVALTKKLIRERRWADADETAAIFRSADALEGARAFAERRPPAWTGNESKGRSVTGS